MSRFPKWSSNPALKRRTPYVSLYVTWVKHMLKSWHLISALCSLTGYDFTSLRLILSPRLPRMLLPFTLGTDSYSCIALFLHARHLDRRKFSFFCINVINICLQDEWSIQEQSPALFALYHCLFPRFSILILNRPISVTTWSPQIKMRFSTPIIICFTALASSTLAHPGHDLTEEIYERATFFKAIRRNDLSHCAAKLEARGLAKRNTERRSATLQGSVKTG